MKSKVVKEIAREERATRLAHDKQIGLLGSKKKPKQAKKKRIEPVVPQSASSNARFQTLGRMTRLGLRAGESTASTGGAEIITAMQAARDALKVMMNPFTDAALARWPDPFTLEPTMTAKDVEHHSLNIWNGVGEAYDGGAGLYIRGDPTSAYTQPSSIDSSTTSSRYTITWRAPDNDLKDSVPTEALARPVAIGHRLTYSGVGPYHAIVVRVVEIPPWAPILSGWNLLPAFPLKSNEGPNFYQREFFRAREVTLNPGESLVLMSYPLDALGLVFASVGMAREEGVTWDLPAAASWNGYIVWATGLSASDTLYHDAVIHHEFVLPVSAVFPNAATGIYPKAVVKPDGGVLDGALGSIVDVIATGANVFKTVLTKGEEIFRAFVPMLGSPQAPVVPPMSVHAVAPTMSTMVAMGLKPSEAQLSQHPRLKRVPVGCMLKPPITPAAVDERKVVDESKTLEEQPVMLTPTNARRPSLAPSLAGKARLR